jgi:hypothetical protein
MVTEESIVGKLVGKARNGMVEEEKQMGRFVFHVS